MFLGTACGGGIGTIVNDPARGYGRYKEQEWNP